MSKLEITNFDIVQYLDDKEIIAEYLSQILSDANMNELLESFRNIALKQKVLDSFDMKKKRGVYFSLYKNNHINSKI
ncbi:DNA-binding protein [Aliarcobacter butzleri]|uniref:helix-turn-helix domain-containing transcriptional regulator n=1 Tax=Aliarcobacter butzleri TaxID=28197 RepID=UPI003AF80BA3